MEEKRFGSENYWVDVTVCIMAQSYLSVIIDKLALYCNCVLDTVYFSVQFIMRKFAGIPTDLCYQGRVVNSLIYDLNK